MYVDLIVNFVQKAIYMLIICHITDIHIPKSEYFHAIIVIIQMFIWKI